MNLQENDLLPEKLTWSEWPAKERPFITVIVIAVLILLWYITYSWLPSIPVATLLILAVFIYLGEYFFPNKFGIDNQKAWKKIGPVKTTKNWDQMRTYYVDKKGVLISPFTRPSRLETFRGIYLRFGKYDRDKIISMVKLYMEKSD